jgi:hypothetical protein
MIVYYILRDKAPYATFDFNEYVEFITKISKRIVKKTQFPDGVEVSTIFLTCEAGKRGGMPVLFETMIFGGDYDEYTERYCTWDEAEAGHEATVQMIINGRLIENTNA